jgi:hypothetical protein
MCREIDPASAKTMEKAVIRLAALAPALAGASAALR